MNGISSISKVYQIESLKDIYLFIANLFNKKIPEDNGRIVIPKSWVMRNSLTKNPERWLAYVMLKIPQPFSVVVEDYHVDRVFRDSYYMFFSNQHFDISRFCKRLSFFNKEITEDYFFAPEYHSELKKSFIGSCVIRPYHDGAIGRTLLDPHIFSNDSKSYQRLSNFTIDVWGVPLSIESFPYSMQDMDTTSCADVTLLNIMDYYSNRYSDYKYLLPSDIINVIKEQSPQRVLPSRGLSYTKLSRVLVESGFSPRLYYEDTLTRRGFTLKQIFHYYIESGIPVALGLAADNVGSGHSVIGIGHSTVTNNIAEADIKYQNGVYIVDTADLCDSYVIMDDNQLPFIIQKFSEISIYDVNPNTIAIPLAKRMFLEATSAYTVSVNILTSKATGIKRILDSTSFSEYKNLGTLDNPLIIRLFLTSARSYKRHKINCTGGTIEMKKIYAKIPLPRFIWSLEVYSEESYKSSMIIGEIVLDATSSGKRNINSVVSIQYLDVMSTRIPDNDVSTLIDGLRNKKIKKWEPMRGFSGNLSPITPEP